MKGMKKRLALLLVCALVSGAAALAEAPEETRDGDTLTITCGDVREVSVYSGVDVYEDKVVIEGNTVAYDGAKQVNIELDSVHVTDSGNINREGIFDMTFQDVGVDVHVKNDVETERNAITTYNVDVDVDGSVKTDMRAVFAADTSTVTVGGDVIAADTAVATFGGGSVTVDGSVTSKNESGVTASGASAVTVGGDVDGNYGVYVSGESTVSVGGDVTGWAYGAKADGNAKAAVGGDVESKNNGIVASDSADVSVKGNVEAGSTGIDAGGSADVSVGGNVEAGSTGIDASGNADVSVKGDVEAGSTGIDAGGSADVSVEGHVTAGNPDGTGILADVSDKGDDDLHVTVAGDVTARGADGVGLRIQGTTESSEKNAVEVVIDGTLSGDSVAVEVPLKEVICYQAYEDGMSVAKTREVSYETPDTTLVVWRAVPNENDEIVRATLTQKNCDNGVYTTTGVVNFPPVARQIEAAIRYIIRTSAERDNAVNGIDNQELCGYKVAGQDEDVVAELNGYGEGDSLEVYYNEDTRLDESQYTVDGNRLLVRMLRGGGMNLLARIIRHEDPDNEPAVENEPPQGGTPAKKKRAKATTRTVLVYVPEADDAVVNGVTAAGFPAAAGALKALSANLGGQGVAVEIEGVEQWMDADQKARFDALSVEDRLLVILSVLNAGEAAEGMSDEALALAGEIGASLDADALSREVVAIDGAEHDSVKIVVVVDRNGQKTRTRYTFFDDGGAWKLMRIERGEYRTVRA